MVSAELIDVGAVHLDRSLYGGSDRSLTIDADGTQS